MVLHTFLNWLGIPGWQSGPTLRPQALMGSHPQPAARPEMEFGAYAKHT